MLYKRYYVKTEKDARDLADILKEDKRWHVHEPVYNVFLDWWEILTEKEEESKGDNGLRWKI